jgi:hypothetical protein
MLNHAADFWPLFWTVLGSGLVLTALVSLLVAAFSPAWFQSRREPAPIRANPPAELRPGRDRRPGPGTKAA